MWQRLRDNNESAVRHELIEYYTPLARRISAQLYGMRPDSDVEFADYMQYALTGLIEAVDKYQLDREANFSTYASYRIRGAILNGVVKNSEKREQNAFWHRQRKDRLDSLLENKQEDADDGLFKDMVELTIGVALSYLLEDSGLIKSQEKSMTDLTYNSEAIDQLQEKIALHVSELPEREQLIIRYHYFHQMTFEELSRMLDVTKGRVSQLHKQALQRLRNCFQGEERLDLYF